MNRLLCVLAVLLTATVVQAQVLELNPVGEELPVPTPSRIELLSPDELVEDVKEVTPDAATKAVTPREVAPNEQAPNLSTLPVREIEGEPIQRGPIHEAFAEPLQLTPEPTKVLKKSPPARVEEMAPEAKPDGKNIEWVPGYWAWDEQRDDYVWVSGVWRKVPVGRRWVAGRWEEVDGGHQWVPGAWLKTNAEGEIVAQEVAKVPPKSLEEGPTSPAPSDDHFWIPGVWKPTDAPAAAGQNTASGFAWRPGFWSQAQTNWVWVPDHYSWSPAGCTFVPGYWDYTWERRGTLYAPCTFGAADLTGRVCYTPSRVIDTNQWLANLWVGPQYGHYYYGDYYDYVGLGYSPWYSYYGANRNFYDPFYTYYRWRFPTAYGFGLYGYLDGLHRYYRRNPTNRPRVSVYGYQDWYSRSRGYNSLYGNVPSLYGRLGRGAYNDRYRYSLDDHLLDHYYRSYRRNDGRNSRYGYGNRGGRPGSPNNSRPQRTVIGYANGQPLYSDQRGRGGVRRAEIGTRGANGVTRSEMGVRRPGQRPGQGNRNGQGNRAGNRSVDQVVNQGRNQDRNRNQSRNSDADRDRRERQRQVAQQEAAQRQRVQREEQERRERARNLDAMRRQREGQRVTNSTRNRNSVPIPQSRSAYEPFRRPNSMRTTVSRPQSRPQVTRSQVSRPQSRPPQVTRSQVSRPQSRPQPQTRPQSRPSRPPAQVSRPRPQSRPQPQVSRPTRSSSPGFSTSGMKRARGADLSRQRAAMQKLMQQRKGRK